MTGAVDVVGSGPFCASNAQGVVQCWGNNGDCQLGRGANAPLVQAGMPLNLEPIGDLVVGKTAVLVRQANGKYRTWGHNNSGEFGEPGSTYGGDICIPATAPAALSAIWDFQPMIGATAMGLDKDGKLYCWGENYYNQCGNGKNGTNADIGTPFAVATDVVAAAAGEQHACYVASTGKVYCSGSQYYGATGTGVVSSAFDGFEKAFTAIPIDDAIGIAAGSYHSCAIRAGGKVSCWGRGNGGQLGNGKTIVAVPTPQEIAGLTDVVQLALATEHSCALKKDGRVYCWGSNGSGELGNGEFGNGARRLVPTLVPASAP